jgi:hypothetical protein
VSLQGLIGAGLIAGGVAAVGWIWHTHAVSSARTQGDKAGYARAVAAGKARLDAERTRNLITERDLRTKLAKADTAAATKEQTYAETLSAAQRRVVSGADRLRCPGAGAISNASAAPDGSAAGGSPPDGPGADLVPAVAVDVLGLAADTGRLVRKYERLEQRYDECRALNNGPAPEQAISSN